MLAISPLPPVCLHISLPPCPRPSAQAFAAQEAFCSLVLIFVIIGRRAKISFNIILLNSAIRIIAIFLLIDLFVFSS